ncbi:polymer-forming cytoskeletal protein [Streptomyces sp. HU2014]|uniref:polymer-forming cytoskeletal protein n=1 Tax=Streptomyces sp. HU2014 TaxID=2939414 RepID=UPI00200FD251|nr:polymer-forming cytoskeletal protein [Streptomyces sp. HU2014]UQI44829.1 polymer-forming cytoskeletal protein [Streptomyces sp. HU2014]
MTDAPRADRATLLSYALTTVPNPLTASPPNVKPGNEDENSYADIDLVISNSGTTPVRCSKIAIVLPVGTLAQDLALTGEGISAYVEPDSGWTVVDVQSDVLLAVPTAETAVFPAAGAESSSKVRFSIAPQGGESEVTVDGLYLTLRRIMVSDKAGVARIGIEEWAAEEGPIPGTPLTTTLEVAKFPFRSGADPAPGIGRALVALTGQGGPPATRVAANAPVRLEWHHVRGDSHELYMDGRRVTDAGIAGGSKYDVPADTVRRDTAFALKTVTPTPDGGFVVRWDHLTVCVTDQTLDALTVSGALQANGSLTTGSAAETKFNHPVSVLNGKKLTATGELRVDGNASVGGTAGITGKLTADGDVQVNKTFKTSTAGESVFYHNVTIYTPAKLVVGKDMQVNGSVTGSLNVAGTVSAGGDVTRGGKGVLAHNDRISMSNTQYGGYLYAPAYDYDGDRAYIFRWKPGNPISNGYWKIERNGTTAEAPPDLPSAEDTPATTEPPAGE